LNESPFTILVSHCDGCGLSLLSIPRSQSISWSIWTSSTNTWRPVGRILSIGRGVILVVESVWRNCTILKLYSLVVWSNNTIPIFQTIVAITSSIWIVSSIGILSSSWTIAVYSTSDWVVHLILCPVLWIISLSTRCKVVWSICWVVSTTVAHTWAYSSIATIRWDISPTNSRGWSTLKISQDFLIRPW